MTPRFSLSIVVLFLAAQLACGGTGGSPSLDAFNSDPGTSGDVADPGAEPDVPPDGVQPDVQPEALAPDLVQEDLLAPDLVQPGDAEPEFVQPDILSPDGIEPEFLETDAIPEAGEDAAGAETTGPDGSFEELFEDAEIPPVGDVAPEAELAPVCVTDDDCADAGETAACHRFACREGECVDVNQEDGTPCADEDLCTGPDTCLAGVCTTGPALTCDDGNPCTVDSCGVFGCQNVPDLTVLTCGVGDCHREIPRCVDGVVQECIPGVPTPEVCDGRDNNCDGEADEANPGAGAACDSGMPGPCTAGTTSCTGGALVCNPNVLPAPERCDGIDNDCDGQVDQGNPNAGIPCLTPKAGVCSVGATACISGLLVCQQTVQPSLELCDGQDNDCDGQVDEDNPGGGLPCSTGKPGVCDEGITACVDGKVGCSPVGQATPETCDGVDNDCDGVIDPAGSKGCTPYLRDADNDSYGVTDDVQCLCAPAAPYTATRGGDCCDIDDRAQPSVTAPFPTLNNCGSFDYNCDGNLTQQYNYGTGSCGWWPVCGTTRGWLGATPTCGVAGKILTDCNFDGFKACLMTTSDVIQGCY